MDRIKILINDVNPLERKAALAERVESFSLWTSIQEKLHPRDQSGKFSKGTPSGPKPGDKTDIRNKVLVKGDQGFKDVLAGLSLGAINEVHKIPETTPPLSITQGDLSRYGARGLYYIGKDNIEIDTSDKGISISLIHEIGHFLDEKMGDLRFDVKLIVSLENSKAIKGLKTSRDAASKENLPGYAYLLSPIEVYARAYSQYVVTRSSNKTLKSELKTRRAEEPNTLWDDKDFEPIGKQFDRIFKTKGRKK